jgi:hypothetical protein
MSGEGASLQHQPLLPGGNVPSFLQLSFDPKLLARPAATQQHQQQLRQQQQYQLQQQQPGVHVAGQRPPLPPQASRAVPFGGAAASQQGLGIQPLGANPAQQQQQQQLAAALAHAAAEAAQQQYNSQQQQQQQYNGYDPQQYAAAGYGGSENGGSYGYYAAGGSRGGGRGGGSSRGRGRGRRGTSSEPGTGSEADVDDEQQQLQQGWPKRRRKDTPPLEAEAQLLVLGCLSALVQDAGVLNQCLLAAMNCEAHQQQQQQQQQQSAAAAAAAAAAVDDEEAIINSKMGAVMSYQLAQSLASNLRGRPGLSLVWQLQLAFSQARK